MSNELTQDRLRQVIFYDQDDGRFIWRVDPQLGRKRKGTPAGSVLKSGYRYIKIDGKLYITQRLAVLYMTGKWPDHLVDFKNNDTQDLRWSNLVMSSGAEVQTRRDKPAKTKGRTSKYIGVSWKKSRQMWQAAIYRNGKLKHLGYFHDEKKASETYEAAKRAKAAELAESKLCN